MAHPMTRKFGCSILGQSAPVSLLRPDKTSEICSSYLKLSTGKNLLVTMPEANPSHSFSSNTMIPKVNELAKDLLPYGIKTFVLIPNKDTEIQEWWEWLQVTHISLFCDPENIISDALDITVTYQGPAKNKNAPEKLHILLEEGTVICVRDTNIDWKFQDLLKTVHEIYSNNQ